MTPSTGPKISSLVVFIPGLTLSSSETPSKKPSPSGAVSRPSTTTFAALVGARSTYDGDLVAVLARDERAHLGLLLHPVADLDLRDPRLDRLDQLVGDVADRDDLETAMQRSPAEP